RVLDDMVPSSPSTAAESLAQQDGDGPMPDAASPSPSETPLMRLPVDALRTLSRANREASADEDGETSQNSVAAMRQMLLDGGNHLERVTGEVAHAWLEHIAHEGLHAWDARRITDSSEQILVQLSRKGLQPRQCLTAQAIVRDTLT